MAGPSPVGAHTRWPESTSHASTAGSSQLPVAIVLPSEDQLIGPELESPLLGRRRFGRFDGRSASQMQTSPSLHLPARRLPSGHQATATTNACSGDGGGMADQLSPAHSLRRPSSSLTVASTWP